MFYDKQSELKKLVDLECDLIDLKFKMLLLNFLKKNYLDLLKTDPDKVTEANFNQYVNILFNLVLEKRTVIVK